MSRRTTTHLHRGASLRSRRIVGAVAAAAMVMSAGVLLGSGTASAAPTPSLGTAATFSVLARAAATIPGATISGEAGAGAALTISGTTTIGGTAHTSNDAATQAALTDLSTAYTYLKGLSATGTLTGDDLGGQTITAGVYHRAAALAATGTVTFSGSNSDIFVIQTDAAMNTTASTKMILTNGALASNIYFVPTGAATLGASSIFDGNILAGAAVTVGASSTVNGRALSVTAAVTLGASVTLAGVTGSSSSGSSGSSGSSSCPSTAAPSLGAAASFSVLAGAATTIPGATISGDVGAKAALTISGSTIAGTTHTSNDAATQSALTDLATAYTYLKGLAATGTLTGDDLGGQTITPGVYHRAAALAATSAVTFDGRCDPTAIFVIQSDAAMNTTASTKMILTNGALASNIYFVPTGAATLGASSTFFGNILAGAAVTVGASSTVNGRAQSVTAAVTLGASVTLAGVTGSSSSGSSGSSGSSSCPSTTAPALGNAAKFSVLAGAATTIPGATISGDVGAAAALTISGSTIAGTTHTSNDAATQAGLTDLGTAYTYLKGLSATGTLTGDDLGGQTITPGVYHRAAALAATSAVTFDAKCDPTAIFVIQSDAALNTTASTTMILANGALASNIYFVPTGAATLGASSTFDGNILAGAAVTVGASSTVNGRALSVTAAVTLGATVTITAP